MIVDWDIHHGNGIQDAFMKNVILFIYPCINIIRIQDQRKQNPIEQVKEKEKDLI